MMQDLARSTDANTELNGFHETAVTAAALRINKPPGLGRWENNVFHIDANIYTHLRKTKLNHFFPFLSLSLAIQYIHQSIKMFIYQFFRSRPKKENRNGKISIKVATKNFLGAWNENTAKINTIYGNWQIVFHLHLFEWLNTTEKRSNFDRNKIL